MFDGIDLDFVAEGLAAKPLVGKIFGIKNIEGALFAGGSPGKVLGELRNRILAADLDQHVIHMHGIGAGLGDILAIFRLAIH